MQKEGLFLFSPPALGWASWAYRPRNRSRDDPPFPPPHGVFLRAVPDPVERLDRGLHTQRRRGGAGNPRMGQLEVGGGGQAAASPRSPRRPPRSRPDLAGRRGSRPAHRASQLYQGPTLLFLLPRSLGTHPPRPPC